MFDIKTPEGLLALNTFLADNAYITGFIPSGEDACTFSGFHSAPDQKYPNVVRWYKNIASFSDDEKKTWPVAGASTAETKKEKDEDFDLFGSEDEADEDAEKARIREQRLQEYAAKKAKKGPGGPAKSNIIFDVKPWDDTIDLAEMEKAVRSIETDGLVWGAAKVLPVAFGIKKLQICCIVEDDKVSSDWLEETITGFEDLVQSVDIVAFNKV
ncbi:hypothetical protein AB6A40_001416 [Gnathostoma spinigerum]|uniref:Elongation factor 1-beta n=1 Tax=Gnathostoma spinigerum TaxID=75299 RepID=A0ABD6EDX9_9BILA